MGDYNETYEAFKTCDCCGDKIKPGMDYYDMDGEIVCENCIHDWMADYRKKHKHIFVA